MWALQKLSGQLRHPLKMGNNKNCFKYLYKGWEAKPLSLQSFTNSSPVQLALCVLGGKGSESFKKSGSVAGDLSQNTLSLAQSRCTAVLHKGKHILRPRSWCLPVIIFFVYITSTHLLSSHKCRCSCGEALFTAFLLYCHADISGHVD